jgi:hypothetical protein
MDEPSCLDIRYPDGSTHRLVKQHLPDDPFDHLVNGGHDSFGIVAFLGAGIKPTRLEDAQIADFAPTILWLRDAPIPSDADGVILKDAFDEELWASRKMRQGGSGTLTAGTERTGFSKEEEEEVRERLKALGYVE